MSNLYFLRCQFFYFDKFFRNFFTISSECSHNFINFFIWQVFSNRYNTDHIDISHQKINMYRYGKKWNINITTTYWYNASSSDAI